MKHQNGAHGITSLGIKTNSHPVWKSKPICVNSRSHCSGRSSHPTTMPASMQSQQPSGEYLLPPRTTKLCKLEGKNIAACFFLEYWLSAKAPHVTVFPFAQQNCIAQPSPDSVGDAKGVLLHNNFYTDSSAQNHCPGMSAKTGSGFGVCEILIWNGSPTICTLETAISARENVLCFKSMTCHKVVL